MIGHFLKYAFVPVVSCGPPPRPGVYRDRHPKYRILYGNPDLNACFISPDEILRYQ